MTAVQRFLLAKHRESLSYSKSPKLTAKVDGLTLKAEFTGVPPAGWDAESLRAAARTGVKTSLTNKVSDDTTYTDFVGEKTGEPAEAHVRLMTMNRGELEAEAVAYAAEEEAEAAGK